MIRKPENEVNNYTENEKLLRLSKCEDENISMKALERLVEVNYGLVKKIALHFRNRGIEYDDLIQIGLCGLLKAIDGFDIEKGFAFSTYATPVITGEIKRQLRDSGPIKISRVYKRNAAILIRERNIIMETEGRDPSISELAERCNISFEDAVAALDASLPVVSLQETQFDDSSPSVLESIECERASEEMSAMIDSIALSQEIENLPLLWKKIVLLRYYRNKTQSECASLLGVTQVKISREEKKILEYLRTRL